MGRYDFVVALVGLLFLCAGSSIGLAVRWFIERRAARNQKRRGVAKGGEESIEVGRGQLALAFLVICLLFCYALLEILRATVTNGFYRLWCLGIRRAYHPITYARDPFPDFYD